MKTEVEPQVEQCLKFEEDPEDGAYCKHCGGFIFDHSDIRQKLWDNDF